jgi:hypothetical protein
VQGSFRQDTQRTAHAALHIALPLQGTA